MRCCCDQKVNNIKTSFPLKNFANVCDEKIKNLVCDKDDVYKTIAEQIKLFR